MQIENGNIEILAGGGYQNGAQHSSGATQSAGTKITIADKNGNVLVSHEPELSYQIVIVSTPELRQGETYTVTVGSSSGDFEA